MTDGQFQNSEPGTPKGNNRSIFYILILVLLLGVNIFLYIKYSQKGTENTQLIENLNSDSLRIDQLNTEYNQALVSIESYKGQNAQLDSMIAVKEKELMQYKNNLSSLQKSKKISDEEYKKQSTALQTIVSDLQNQITQLQQQNNILINKNDSIGKSLAAQITANDKLSSDYTVASKKVAIGSLLKPTTINATGTKSKSSGKEDETNSAKKAEKLKVCFDIPANDVADAGEKTFYVRIIKPEGITLGNATGIITKAEDGSQIQYSTTTTVDYSNEATNACAYWQQTEPYAKGAYTAEIYQDGYLIGTQKFELK